MICSQTKLAEGLNLAKEFHSNVQELLLKMCKCEESIGLLPAPSFVLDTVYSQLQDHRVGLVLNLSCSFFFLSEALQWLMKHLFICAETGK